jgi:uncharacterized protein (DUF4415 family)
MSKTTPKRTLLMPTAAENKAIRAAALADPDAQPLEAYQLKAMVPFEAVRGRPPSANKKLLVSVRYSPEVITYFRATGEGWQARMDGVLKQYVNKQAGKRTRRSAP